VTTMQLISHICDRGIIHFFSSAGVVLCVMHAISYLSRRFPSRFLPAEFMPRLVLAALTVFAVSTMREAYDVHNGQPLVKAFTDYLSWLSGCAMSVWGIYRLPRYRICSEYLQIDQSIANVQKTVK
jgi:hypothetical protein